MSVSVSSIISTRSGSPALSIDGTILLRNSHDLSVAVDVAWSGEGVIYSIPRTYYSAYVQQLIFSVWTDVDQIAFGSTGFSDTGSTTFTFSDTAASLNSLCTTDGQYRVHVKFWQTGAGTVAESYGGYFYLYTYANPAISVFTAVRCLVDGTASESGEYVKVTITYAATSLNSNNVLTLQVYRKLSADSSYTLDKAISVSAYSGTISDNILTLSYVGTGVYNVKAVLTDVVTAANVIKTVQAAYTLVEYDSVNKQVAYGKRVEAGGPEHDVNQTARFRKSFQLDAPITQYGLSPQFADILTDFMTANAYANPPLVGGVIASGTTNEVAGDASGPGKADLKSSTSANSGYQYSTGLSSILLAGGETFELIMSLTTTTNSVFRFGFLDSITTTAPVDGVWFEITGTSLVGKTSSNSTASSTAAYTLTAGTSYRLKITVNSTVLVTFEVYSLAGTLLWTATLATNIPTAAGRNTGIVLLAYNTGTSALQLAILDWLWVRIYRTLTR